MIDFKHQGNLYDSIINEVEKINEYERNIIDVNEFSACIDQNEDDIYNKLSDSQKRALNFIRVKEFEIVSNKLLRSYFTLLYAIERQFYSVIKRCEGKITVTYSGVIRNYFYDQLAVFRNAKSRDIFYNTNKSPVPLEVPYNEIIDWSTESMKKYVEENGDETPDVTLTVPDFEVKFNRTFEAGRSFCKVLTQEMTRMDSLKKQEMVIKYMITMANVVSVFIENLQYE